MKGFASLEVIAKQKKAVEAAKLCAKASAKAALIAKQAAAANASTIQALLAKA